MTRQPKGRKPHPVLHGIGLVLSAILLVAVLAGTYVLSTLATVIDSFFGAPSGHYSDAEIADTKVKAEALAADVEAEGTVLVQNNENTLPLAADTKKVNVFGWASTAWLGGGSGSGGVNAVNTDLLAALTAYGIEYNTELTDMYKDFQPGREYAKTLRSRPEQSGRLYEPDISNTTYYTQSMLDNAKRFSDTAVVVIGRLAGESNDATKQQYKRTEKGGDIVVDDTRTMLELICVCSGSVKRINVSIPLSLRFTSAMLFSYSKSFTVRIPRRINPAFICWAKSTVRESYDMTRTRGSSL
mgnify:FL=1